MLTDFLGRALGVVFAPVSGALSFIRHARMFHPEGVLYRAEVFPVSREPAAQRLGGPALARFSSAWWKHREWPDVLGLALRFRETSAPSVEPAPGDQDLLLATVTRPWTTPFAPLSTHVHDFLANDYYGVSPFEVPGLGMRYLRVAPTEKAPGGSSRNERLEQAVTAGTATLKLKVSESPRGPFTDFAEVRLVELLDDVDQEALRFSPFRDGRGLTPKGLVHGLRRAVYAVSQSMRPAHGPS